MLLRFYLDRRKGQTRDAVVHALMVRPPLTVLTGMIGGVIVGMTSVGSGSLMIVLLLFLYPMIGANQLVGTDLIRPSPLTIAAALGAPRLRPMSSCRVTSSIIIGSVPAVVVGSFISSEELRIGTSARSSPFVNLPPPGLKYVGVGTSALGWILCHRPASEPRWRGSSMPDRGKKGASARTLGDRRKANRQEQKSRLWARSLAAASNSSR